MISFIKGVIQKKTIENKTAFVDIFTNGGVGYRIAIPSTYSLPMNGEEYSLFTHFYVKEDTQALYGFETEEERSFFEQLIQISGIGPKIGISILSSFSREDLEDMIEEGDAKSLSKVPGLGLKRAQKIIIELRGILDLTKKEEDNSSLLKDLKEALRALGFGNEDIKEKVESGSELVKKEGEIEIGELIKRVLKN